MTTDYDLRNVPRDWLDALKIVPSEFEPGYTPVLATTITRQTDRGRQVLATVRSTLGNRTHPGVLSVPTIRIRGTEPLAWMSWCVDRLLATKLESTTPAPKPSWYSVWQGESVIGQRGGKPVTEKLAMINVHLPLNRPFRSSTHDYSWIGYVDEDKFIAATGARDAGLLGVDWGGDVPLMYGMCTLSTAATLEAIE